MSNSSLVTYKRISPNRTSPRNHVIDTVSVHCAVGMLTAKQIVSLDHFLTYDPDYGASCNYAVGYDGSIAMSVEEDDRSWCTSNRANDHRAITIEVASGTKHPYTVTEAAYKALIDLLVDICQRNPGIGKLKWKADKSLIGQPDKQNMTVHRWFANKTCPGEWLYSRHAQIAAEVNARLDTESSHEPETPTPTISSVNPASVIKKGDLVALESNAEYYNGSDVPRWVLKRNWYVKEISGDRAVIDKSEDGKNSINSPVNVKYLTVVKAKEDTPYMVRIGIPDLRIRSGPGTGYDILGVTGEGVFTIVEVQNGVGSESGWGLLKAYKPKRNGWVSLDYCKKV